MGVTDGVGITAKLLQEGKDRPVTTVFIIALVIAVAYGSFVTVPAVISAETALAAVNAQQDLVINSNKQTIAQIQDETKQIKQSVVSIRAGQLREALGRTRGQQCAAATSDGKQYFQDQLQQLEGQYQELTQQQWQVPDCSIYR